MADAGVIISELIELYHSEFTANFSTMLEGKDITENQRELITKAGHRFVKKILHPNITFLKEIAGDQDALLKFLKAHGIEKVTAEDEKKTQNSSDVGKKTLGKILPFS